MRLKGDTIYKTLRREPAALSTAFPDAAGSCFTRLYKPGTGVEATGR